jgi:SAM-dependent methyltransferase
MLPFSLRDVSERRWRQAQAHEAAYWKKPSEGAPRGSRRVATRYVGFLRDLSLDGPEPLILEVGSGPTCATRAVDGSRRVIVDPLASIYHVMSPSEPGEWFAGAVGEALPFRDDTFDAVFSFNALDHVFSPSRFLAELIRVTRPKGHVVVGVYTHPRPFALVRTALERAVPWMREVPHPFFFSRRSLERLLRHHALDVERLLRVHAARRWPWLHRQDWIAVARK